MAWQGSTVQLIIHNYSHMHMFNNLSTGHYTGKCERTSHCSHIVAIYTYIIIIIATCIEILLMLENMHYVHSYVHTLTGSPATLSSAVEFIHSLRQFNCCLLLADSRLTSRVLKDTQYCKTLFLTTCFILTRMLSCLSLFHK